MASRSIDDQNKNLGFGLNARGSAAAAAGSSKKKKKTKKGSVFDDDEASSSSEDDDNIGGGGRSAVNREIAAEQAALRRRAEAAMAASSNVYNYDEGYETFSKAEEAKKREEAARAQAANQPERKSRYIDKLLQTAEVRKREHDILYERRVAREQAAEDAANDADYAGKDKFVTKSYKRKLAEREAWLREEEARDREEEEAAKARKEGKGGLGMASFLGSVVRGDDDKLGSRQEEDKKKQGDMGGEFTDGFSRGGDDGDEKEADQGNTYVNADEEYRPKLAAARSARPAAEQPEKPPPSKEEVEAAIRRKRNAKIVAARERYLERKRSGRTAALFGAAQ